MGLGCFRSYKCIFVHLLVFSAINVRLRGLMLPTSIQM
jgi:hypothetical protein